MSSSAKLLETARAYQEALENKDEKRILELRTPDCIQHYFPSSLNRPPQTNTEYTSHFRTMDGIFWGWESETLDTLVDAPAHKISIHSVARADSIIGPYVNEMVFTMWMTDDDSQVKQVREFVDSGFVKDFFGRLMKKKAERAAEETKA